MSRSIKISAIIGVLIAALALMIVLAVLGMRGRSEFRTNDHAAAAESDQPYTVTMSPMGEVRFTHVPQRIVTLDAHYNDMLVTLDQQHHLLATGTGNNLYDGYYKQLPGVDSAIDADALKFLYGQSGSLFDKETLYALNADVHHIDPLRLAHSHGWTMSDVQEIARNVGPFFANRYSRTNDYPGDEPYQFYTMWQLSDRVAQVYRQPQRVAQLKAVYDEMVSKINAKLPPVDRRPSVGLVIYMRGRFLPFSLSRQGFGTAQYRAVGAVDAFAPIQDKTYADAGRGTQIDLEALLAINPDVLIVPWAIYPASRASYERLLTLADDPLGGRLSAIQHHRVYPGGSPLQGPIFLLFQTEMAAKQIYPDLFGAYRDDQQYPLAEQLFDRQRVADILNGNVDDAQHDR